MRIRMLILPCCVVTGLLSGCVSLKPEHPQAFQKFDSRRVPIENSMVRQYAISQEMSAQEAAKTANSRFSPFSGKVMDDTSPKHSSIKDSLGSEVQIPQIQTKSGTEQGGESSSFLDKLRKVFSTSKSEGDTLGVATAYSRKRPIENSLFNDGAILVADMQYRPVVEQGDAAVSDFYEAGHDVDYSSGIVMYADGRNAASSLVNIPQMPSHEEIKKEAISSKQPSIVDVQNAVDAYEGNKSTMGVLGTIKVKRVVRQ